MNLWGVARIDDFDSCQDRESRLADGRDLSVSVVVIGSGGSELWRALKRRGFINGRPRHGFDPLDSFSRRMISEEAEQLHLAGFEARTVFPFSRKPMDFLRLAEAAGLGTLSPVVPFLIHPEFGPWVSLRGALIVEEELRSNGELEDFLPCRDCSCPCLDACPVEVYGPAGEAHLSRCADERHDGGCEGGCEVRRACPVGREHRYDPDEEAFRHWYGLPALRRYYGKGWWQIVPKRIRRSL
ncbi:MAG: hypothetical protein ACE5F1_00115 [Planctomycetota bacterium]